MSTSRKFPAIFLSHGSPMMLLPNSKSPVKALWAQLGAKYHMQQRTSSSPKAILVISAHYTTSSHDIRIAARDSAYPINYDFYGFPDELYKVKYHAKGSVAYAQKVLESIKKAFSREQVNVALDTQYAMDHGAMVPLLAMTGQSTEIPVVVMSVNTDLAPRVLLELGRKALAPLRDELIIVASGSEVHRIRDFFSAQEVYGDVMPLTKESVQFSGKLREVLGDTAPSSGHNSKTLQSTVVTRHYEKQILPEMARYREDWPHASHQHPTDEHFRPIFYAIGASVETQDEEPVVNVQYLYQGVNPTGVIVFGESEKI